MQLLPVAWTATTARSSPHHGIIQTAETRSVDPHLMPKATTLLWEKSLWPIGGPIGGLSELASHRPQVANMFFVNVHHAANIRSDIFKSSRVCGTCRTPAQDNSTAQQCRLGLVSQNSPEARNHGCWSGGISKVHAAWLRSN
jgi:hypothetical protein